ncbi:hypothetical protein P3X46_010555 [Hevea brasiliensis]|uniref:Uncharacterized protein n=1 Tax=Hevea brasiliensis TaxID=3981 RepID=A0ABQ9MET6_HEVBR|nr:hypothetical protein P3X46_010555 [Hevea brasiliensis]
MEMQMQKEWVNGNCNYCNNFHHREGEEPQYPPTISCNGDGDPHNNNSFLISSTNVYPFPFSSLSTTTTTTTMASPGCLGFIQSPVSRLDTLAGVAIKYGVE